MNSFKTALLLTALTLLFIFMGRILGGARGMILALILACAMNFLMVWMSPKIVLSAYRAQALTREDAPEVFDIVQDLSLQAGLPMPQVYLIPSSSLNAFATGRDPEHAVIALTQGIITELNCEELSGVIAHEFAHIEHRDILISALAASLAGAISTLSSLFRYAFMFGGARRMGGRGPNPLVLLITAFFAPFGALLVQLAVSRSREYAADQRAAQLTGNPLYLASALKRLETLNLKRPLHGAEPHTAHLFIANPLTGKGLTRLFSTHPPMTQRIARLEAMARQQGI